MPRSAASTLDVESALPQDPTVYRQTLRTPKPCKLEACRFLGPSAAWPWPQLTSAQMARAWTAPAGRRAAASAALVAMTLGALAALAASPGATAALAACPHADAKAHKTSLANLRDAMRCLVNNKRAKHGRRPLADNDRLAKAAKRHTNVMLRRNCFKHRCKKSRRFASASNGAATRRAHVPSIRGESRLRQDAEAPDPPPHELAVQPAQHPGRRLARHRRGGGLGRSAEGQGRPQVRDVHDRLRVAPPLGRIWSAAPRRSAPYEVHAPPALLLPPLPR